MKVYRRRIGPKGGAGARFSPFYYIEFSVGRGPTARRIRESSHKRTRKEAEAVLSLRYAEECARVGVPRQGPNPGDVVTLAAAVEMWAASPALSTVIRGPSQDAAVARRFAEWVGEGRTPGQITTSMVATWADQARGNVRPQTVNRNLSMLSAFWRWMHARGIVDDPYVVRRAPRRSEGQTPFAVSIALDMMSANRDIGDSCISRRGYR